MLACYTRVLALSSIIAASAPTVAQSQDTWRLGVGVADAMSTQQRKMNAGVAAIGDFNGRFLRHGVFALSATATAGRFVQSQIVCTESSDPSSCDLSGLLSYFGALTLTADAQTSRWGYAYFARVGAGPWWGREQDAPRGESPPADRGALLTMEIGSRAGRTELGWRKSECGERPSERSRSWP